MNEMFSQGGKGSTGILTNKQAIARKFGVKQNEVVYFSVGVDLGGYKVLYDKATQRSYSLPALPVGTTAVSLSKQAVLVHSAGTVDLGELAATRREFVCLSDSFATGLVVNTRNELIFHNGIGYTYLGSLPVTISAGINPVGNVDWKPQTDPNIRQDLSNFDGFKRIGNCPSVAQLRLIEPDIANQRIFVLAHTAGGKIGAGYFYYDNTDTSSTDDDGVVIVTSGGKRWKRECTYISTDFYGLVPGTVVDMSVALNKALQAAKKSKYKRLVCTEGTLYVNAALKVPSGVTVSGSGNYASAIMALPTMPITENVIQNEKHVYQVFGTDYDEDIHIENLTIDANNRARNTSETWMDATQGTTILLSTVRNSSIKNAGYAVTCNMV